MGAAPMGMICAGQVLEVLDSPPDVVKNLIVEGQQPAALGFAKYGAPMYVSRSVRPSSGE